MLKFSKLFQFFISITELHIKKNVSNFTAVNFTAVKFETAESFYALNECIRQVKQVHLQAPHTVFTVVFSGGRGAIATEEPVEETT